MCKRLLLTAFSGLVLTSLIGTAAAVAASPPEVHNGLAATQKVECEPGGQSSCKETVGVTAEVRTFGAETHWQYEYEFSEYCSGNGVWKPVPGGSGVISAEVESGTVYHKAQASIVEIQSAGGSFCHLMAVRVVATSVGGTTQAVEPLRFRYAEYDFISATIAEFKSGPFQEGERWRFEYSTSEAGPWSEPAGGSGVATASQKSALVELTGLTPETPYYIRTRVTTEAGTLTSRATAFSTSRLGPGSFDFDEGTGAFTKVTESSAVLSGGLIPHLETHWRFEYATAESGPWSTVPGATGIADASERQVKVKAPASGLKSDTRYWFRLHAENEAGEETSHSASLLTPGPPQASAFAAHALQGDEVWVFGSVVPHSFDTHYHFEYVTAAQFAEGEWAAAASTTEGDAGSSAEATETVTGKIAGLQPGVEYDIRVVAENAAKGGSTVDSAPASFKAPVPAAESSPPCPNEAFRTGFSAALPDCRAYEQVTPVDKGGAQDLFREGESPEKFTVAEDGEGGRGEGERLAMLTQSRIEPDPAPAATQYVFVRTPSGWTITSTETPQADGLDISAEIFSPDLTEAAVLSYTAESIVKHSAAQQFEVGPIGGPYTTVASTPFNAINGLGLWGLTDRWLAASRDFHTVVFETLDTELLGRPSGTVKAPGAYDLYEWANGQLSRVNVQNDGSPISSCGAYLASGAQRNSDDRNSGADPEFEGGPNSISADGALIFFEDKCTHHLYMRVDGRETVDLGAYRMDGATPDGSKVLMGNASEEILYDTATRTGHPLAGFPTTGEQNAKAFEHELVSEDLSTVYIGSGKQLVAGAPSTSINAALNLYRYDVASQSLRFITHLSGSAGPMADDYVTPDGRFYYFGEIGGVGGLPAGEGETEQVYRYDSADQSIVCVSCASPYDPRPAAFAELPMGWNDEASIRAPGGLPRILPASDNGKFAFFTTAAELVPQDINGEVAPRLNGLPHTPSTDVYEWRADGVYGCGRVAGCVSLITTGQGDTPNWFVGTDPSGRDVFIGTHSRLLASDEVTAGNVFDARIGGGFPAPPPRPTECEGDACAAPVLAPIDQTPSSFTFNGAGNLVQAPAVPLVRKSLKCRRGTRPAGGRCVKARRCARGKKRRRGRCVKAKGRRASSGRRGSGRARSSRLRKSRTRGSR